VTNDYCVMLYCTWRSEDDKSGCTCISHTCFTLTHLHIFGNSVGKGGSSHMFVLFSLLTCPSVTTLFSMHAF
jgi:hypothetical protein